MYEKRDQILESSNRLLDIADKIDGCEAPKIKSLITEAQKELNIIISHIHELSPHLKNPWIAEGISKQIKILSLMMEQAAHSAAFRGVVSMTIKVGVCQEANRTILKPTPKSIKQAFGITVSPRDIKLLFEHHQENY